MKLVIAVGGNKKVSAARLGVQVAAQLQAAGREVLLVAPKGVVKFASGVALKEYAPSATVKTLTGLLKTAKAERVISLMNLAVCEAAAQSNIPFVYAEYAGFKEDKAVKTKKALLKKAARVLVLTGREAKLPPKTYTGMNARAITAPAIWVEHYNYKKPACFKKENNILAVSPLTKESGLYTLLKSWARLAAAHTTWHLTIVGDGTQKMVLNQFIKTHQLQASTELISASCDVQSLLRSADIFAYPALNPARADILLDAMASKLPCVACESAAAEEFITNGVNGVIVNAGEEEPFTIALDDLMVNWGKRVGLAIEAGKHKDTFAFDAFMAVVSDSLK